MEWIGRRLSTNIASFGPRQASSRHESAELVVSEQRPDDPTSLVKTLNADGKIVLVEYGHRCSFVETAMNAQKARAIAVVTYSNREGTPVKIPYDAAAKQMAAQIKIPVVSISHADANQLSEAVKAGITRISLCNNGARFLFCSGCGSGAVPVVGLLIRMALCLSAANVNCLDFTLPFT